MKETFSIGARRPKGAPRERRGGRVWVETGPGTKGATGHLDDSRDGEPGDETEDWKTPHVKSGGASRTHAANVLFIPAAELS